MKKPVRGHRLAMLVALSLAASLQGNASPGPEADVAGWYDLAPPLIPPICGSAMGGYPLVHLEASPCVVGYRWFGIGISSVNIVYDYGSTRQQDKQTSMAWLGLQFLVVPYSRWRQHGGGADKECWLDSRVYAAAQYVPLPHNEQSTTITKVSVGYERFFQRPFSIGAEAGWLQAHWATAFLGVRFSLGRFTGAIGGWREIRGSEVAIGVYFTDGNGTGPLESGEAGELTITIRNLGDRPSRGVQLQILTPTTLRGCLTISERFSVGRIAPGKTKPVQIPVRAASNIPTGEYEIRVTGTEIGGKGLGTKTIKIRTKQTEPPYLAYDVTPIDDNKNGVFEPGEMVGFRLDLRNSGRGAAYKVRASVEDAQGREVASQDIGQLNPAEKRDIALQFQAPTGLREGEARYSIRLTEASGFAPEARPVRVPTGGEQAVLFDVAVSVDDDQLGSSRGNDNGAIEKGEVIELGISVTNRGVSTARGVTASLSCSQGGIEMRTARSSLGDIPAYGRKEATLVFDVKQGLSGSNVKLSLAVTEQTGKFTSRRDLSYELGRPAEEEFVSPDRRLPVRPNTYALVVGVSRYEDSRVSRVEYAEKDARAVAAALEASGFEYVWLLAGREATRNAVQAKLAVLEDLAGEGSSVYIFFAGHGAPAMSRDDKRGPYVLPWDVQRENSASLRSTSLSLAEIRDAMLRMEADAVMLTVSACFSEVPEGTAPIGITDISLDLPENRVAITAAAADQFAYDHNDYGHSIFAYRLLEALEGKADAGEKDGWIDSGELFEYLLTNVKSDAIRFRQSPQTPTRWGEGHFRVVPYR